MVKIDNSILTSYFQCKYKTLKIIQGKKGSINKLEKFNQKINLPSYFLYLKNNVGI